MAKGKDVAQIVALAIRRTGSIECNGGFTLPDREIAHAQRIAQHIADELARECRDFSRDRFMTQCGFPPRA